MRKNTPAVSPAEDWVGEVAEIWDHLVREGNKPDLTHLAAALAERLKINTTIASGLLAGFQTLVQYARLEQDHSDSALEEER